MKFLKMTKLLSGLSAILCIIFIIAMFGGQIALDNSGNVNAALNSVTSIIVKDENAEQQDTIYHKTTVGDGTLTDANRAALWAEAYEQNVNEMKEGAALLKNESCLPLKADARITLMGHATVQPLYDCMAAGTRVSYAPSHLISYVNAMKNAGFMVNEAMITALSDKTIATANRVGRGSGKGVEEPISFYDAQRSTYQSDFKDAAILIFAREGAEGYDILMDDDDDAGGSASKISSLKLHKNEVDLLERARADFDKVIVLLNSPYQLEVEEIKKNADAILYIGAPGHRGFEAVAGILNGTVNPSGRLADTYAVNSLSAPAVVNSGTRSPEFTNLSEIHTKLGDPSNAASYSESENVETVSVQVENIYIGYRYYETRYADCIYGGRGADNSAGSSVSGAWKYENEISYPFGYGLSYSDFKQTIVDFKQTNDEVEVTVKVENTSGPKGKSVVQLYAQTPYDEYEKTNGVEKSAIQLVGFGKTKKLTAGGESENIKITVDKYLLASYDQNKAEGYILSGGTYYFAVGESCHDALNNILDMQGYDSVKGDKTKARSYTQGMEIDKYKKSETGVVVTNRFEDRDLNYWKPNAATYISRKDWANTYPKAPTLVSANDKMIDALSGKWYKTTDKSSPYYDWSEEARSSTLTYNDVAGKFQDKEDELKITLPTLRETPVSDKIWYDFIYQMSIDNLAVATGENLSNNPVGTLAPGFNVGDGCDSGMVMRGYTVFDPETGDATAKNDGMSLRYCSGSILAGTFNAEIHANRGRILGEEGLWAKHMMISGGGYDLHRTPFGGRNFEYKSECPTLTYFVSISETEAMEATGVHMAPKHFCSNDQETQREGHTVFMTEQAFREGSLRGFEGSLRVAGAGGLMSSFERIGMIWSSADYALNVEVLRGEWGFDGFILTDASKADSNVANDDGYFNHYKEGFVGGTTNWCFDTDGVHGQEAIKYAKANNDGYLLSKVVDSAKYWLQAISSSPVINGIGTTDKIVPVTPGWQTAIHVARIVSGIIAGLLIVAAISGSVLKFIKREDFAKEGSV